MNDATLAVLAAQFTPTETVPGNAYELSADLRLTRLDDPAVAAFVAKNTPIPAGILFTDDASVVYEEGGIRWRLPRSEAAAHDGLLARSGLRKNREVCTERDLLQAHGTFYELPALNAGGAIRMRPIATSDTAVHDYCSYRGLLVLSGIDPAAGSHNRHIIRSADGRAAVWVGAVDDLWKLGKPRGHGGPWKRTLVEPGKPSDPYLMTGYDRKKLLLENHGTTPTEITLELDAAGDGRFSAYRAFTLPAGGREEFVFPAWLNAYWLRTVSSAATTATALLTYE